MMQGLQRLFKILWHLFVDDGQFACLIVLWLVSAPWLLPGLGLPSALTCLAFFGGFAALLLYSTAKRAKRP